MWVVGRLVGSLARVSGEVVSVVGAVGAAGGRQQQAWARLPGTTAGPRLSASTCARGRGLSTPTAAPARQSLVQNTTTTRQSTRLLSDSAAPKKVVIPKEGSGILKFTLLGTAALFIGYASYFYLAPEDEEALQAHNEKIGGPAPLGKTVRSLKSSSAAMSSTPSRSIESASGTDGVSVFQAQSGKDDDAQLSNTINAAPTPPSPKEIKARNNVMSLLRQHTYTLAIDSHGISDVSSCWLNANAFLEDRSSKHVMADGIGCVVGMYDGHSGFQTSEVLSLYLPTYIQSHLKALKDAGKSLDDVAEAAEAIAKSFEEFDHDYCFAVPELALQTQEQALIEAFAKPCFSGAVSCVAIIDKDNIFVANTGDCRAVLGIEVQNATADATADATGTGAGFAALPLSNDQTGDTPSEVLRIQREHPDEPKCVFRGRVLGRLQPSRAFGDAKFKWPAEQIRKLDVRVPSHSLTPPYVTARPEVLHMKRDAAHKFVILATDGVWDVVQSDVAVNVVADNLAKGGSAATASQALAMFALEQYAHEGEYPGIAELMAVPQEMARKTRDDITCQVLLLDSSKDGVASEQAPEAKNESLVQVFESEQRKFLDEKHSKSQGPPPHAHGAPTQPQPHSG